MQINPVQQRPRNALTVVFDLPRRAATLAFGVPVKPARAGVHGGDEHEVCGKRQRSGSAGDGDIAVFRLPCIFTISQNSQKTTFLKGFSAKRKPAKFQTGDFTSGYSHSSAVLFIRKDGFHWGYWRCRSSRARNELESFTSQLKISFEMLEGGFHRDFEFL